MSALQEFKTLREFKWNQPFHYEVPSFPINKSSKRRRHDLDGESTIRGSNVPSYLPAFPPRHTYSRKVKKVKALEQREVQVKAVSATRSIQATLSKIESADV